MWYYCLLVMIVTLYNRKRNRSLNKIEVCFSPKRRPEESSADVVGSFSVLSLASISVFLLSPPWASFHRKQEEARAKEDGRTKQLLLQLSQALISLPRSSIHASAQHLICQNLVICPKEAGKYTLSGHIATQTKYGLVLWRVVGDRQWGSQLVQHMKPRKFLMQLRGEIPCQISKPIIQ